MSRYMIDSALCSGHGLCAQIAPAVYTLDADGFNMVVDVVRDIPAGLEGQAEDGAAACPDQAIRIFD
jgi:ferredoxin